MVERPGARALMVLGTASHVGKSIITAGLGRIFADEGYRVAPFKAQNMSLNSAVTPDGAEIGRAQALQAEACRVTARAEMNPILIKPSSDTGAQLVVMGRVWGQITAGDYHRGQVEELVPIVLDSYHTLARQHDVIIIEGAGSPAEINLKQHDIVNMRMASAAQAACVLVADIDRGGVFAALFGTLALLPDNERSLIRGFIINKFRGDISLLYSGIQMMEERAGIPCLGVVPFLNGLGLDEEDGVAMEQRRTAARIWRDDNVDGQRPLRIGVVAFPHLANFTDFDALASEPSVALAFLDKPYDIFNADILILPGTKQTLDDLQWLNVTGLSHAIRDFWNTGGRMLGICGGMQILGLQIEDPDGMESGGKGRRLPGLGVLPITTVLRSAKTTRRVTACLKTPQLWGVAMPVTNFSGYEIHLGETLNASTEPFSSICRAGETIQHDEGTVTQNGRCFGTYIHGLFDADDFRHAFIHASRTACALAPANTLCFVTAQREARIDRLARHLRSAINVPLIESWVR